MAKENNNQHHNEEYEYDTLTNDKLIKDHDYDGIRELDNDMPAWWKWLFYITIIFAIVYSIRLFVFHSDDLVQEREYENAMAEGEMSKPVQAETAAFEIVVLEDDASLANGEETWDKICAVCHLVDGGGLVGPNMTDNFWIHGNTVEDLYNIVEIGVIEKGMIPYRDQLSEQKRLEVVSFILVNLHGSTPAVPKAPEGDEY